MSHAIDALNPAQQRLLGRLSKEIRLTCERVANEERRPLTEGEFTTNPSVCGISPHVEILYSGTRVIVPITM